MISKRFYGFSILFVLCAFIARAQDKPIGYWDSYLPYNSSLGIATDGSTIFNVCNQGFYTYSPVKNDLEAYSKVNGMSDIGMQCVGYDAATGTTILVYTDGNIDLFKDYTFYNIPDLKIKAVSGSKAVYHVYTENGIAYLSSALGVLLIDLTAHDFLETYQFNAHGIVATVLDFTSAGDSFYAVTSAGLYCAAKNSPALQDFAVWQCLDSTHTFNYIANVNNRIYLSNSSTVYAFGLDTVLSEYNSGAGGVSYINERIVDTAIPVYVTDSIINHIDGGGNHLFISEYISHAYSGAVFIMGATNQIIDSFFCSGIPVQTLQLADSSVWIADSYWGLQKRVNDTGKYQTSYISVPGPVDANSYSIYANNHDLWVTHGTYTDKYNIGNNFNGFSHFNNNKWVNYGRNAQYFPFDTMIDFVTVIKDEITGVVYAGSFVGGLYILQPSGSYQVVKNNSILDPSNAYGDSKQIIGLALDQSDNLWITEMFPKYNHQLYVKTADSNWYSFSLPCFSNGGPIVVDNYGQVWFVAIDQSESGVAAGVGVYNTNNTISDPSDDTFYCLQKGVGLGNLPSNTVYCLAKDLDNNIWIGTSDGIGIVSNCQAPFSGTPPCDAQIPIVQYDQFAGYLFSGYNIRAIAVDGANRKWVGTDNGVWLLSSDASKIVYQFTQSNSPLPSNYIQSISIDQVTGEVYIGTQQGMVSFRSTATEGGTSNSNVIIFPDPVPSGYTGTIAINGLVANADVRITDISGNLVYRTTALGGQAVWNGVDYKGHRPQSGVYLVFASSADGSQTWSGKMVFIQ